MFKAIKWIIRLVVLVALVIGAGYVYFVFLNPGQTLTEVQKETIATLGRPAQFSISYLPQDSDEGGQLVRQEVWFYPSQKQKLVFLSGQLIATEDLEVPDNVEYAATMLKSEDFDFYTTLADVEKMVGKLNLAEVDMPGFFDEQESGLRTYAAKQGAFIFEQGYLTYMETLD